MVRSCRHLSRKDSLCFRLSAHSALRRCVDIGFFSTRTPQHLYHHRLHNAPSSTHGFHAVSICTPLGGFARKHHYILEFSERSHRVPKASWHLEDVSEVLRLFFDARFVENALTSAGVSCITCKRSCLKAILHKADTWIVAFCNERGQSAYLFPPTI